VQTERPEDRIWMQEALAEARRAAEIGEVPIGAVIVREGEAGEKAEIIGRGHNRREIDGDPLAHAEILAIRQAAERVGGWRLTGCTMYVTLEPCAMCAGALVNSRIERLVWGAPDPKAGWCGTLGNLVQDPRLNHRLAMTAGVLEEDSAALLRGFFASLRKRF
jgi:tRNA(adenine34) deaminase